MASCCDPGNDSNYRKEPGPPNRSRHNQDSRHRCGKSGSAGVGGATCNNCSKSISCPGHGCNKCIRRDCKWCYDNWKYQKSRLSTGRNPPRPPSARLAPSWDRNRDNNKGCTPYQNNPKIGPRNQRAKKMNPIHGTRCTPPVPPMVQASNSWIYQAHRYRSARYRPIPLTIRRELFDWIA